MQKITAFCLLITTCFLLQACCNAIPPSRINWQNEPGKIQRINMSPQSTYYKQYMAHP